MKIRIQGEGHPRSWKITNAETGETLPVVDLKIKATPAGAEATLTLRNSLSIDLTGNARVRLKCPRCGVVGALEAGNKQEKPND